MILRSCRARRGDIIPLLIWALTSAVIVAVPLAFPDFATAAFFSHSLVEAREPVSFTDIYFTANPFDALSRAVVPAVLVFSSLMGIGLMGLKGKERLLAPLGTRGSLRIGYDPNNLPMSFFNSDGQLVGFDVEMGERLAGALGLRAEFVPVAWQEVPQLLEQRIIDVTPGVWLRPFWFSSVRLSQP